MSLWLMLEPAVVYRGAAFGNKTRNLCKSFSFMYLLGCWLLYLKPSTVPVAVYEALNHVSMCVLVCSSMLLECARFLLYAKKLK